ncbi:MAG TPA: c-type cytochrome [Pseudacidobacterium sp.]|nr:c-type cytochrome [Pseudacidobacterium sp.]
MKRLLLATATALFLTHVCATAQDAPPKQTSHQRMPLPKPTNLKVLPKNISPEDLMKVMRGYSQALGVHCDFCHEVNEQTHQPNFASDAKPDKAIARTMIAMTQTINQKYMSTINDPDATPEMKTVTCGTCHRGDTMPPPFQPKPEDHPKNASPQHP